MSTLKNILPVLLLAFPMAMANVGSDYPQPPSDSQVRDINSGQKSAVTIHVIISVAILVVFVVIIVTLTTIGSRRRRQRHTQYAGKLYNRPGANAAAPPYSVADDVNLPAYSYAPANGENSRFPAINGDRTASTSAGFEGCGLRNELCML